MNSGARGVALFPTCLVDAIAPQVGVACVRVLRRRGFEVSVPEEATCCGQPAWNSGFAEEAAKVAHTTLRALSEDPSDTICVPAGSCATMIRVFWPELFDVVGDHDSTRAARDLSPRVKEFSELVAEGRDDLGGSFPRRVAYHHSCHMLRELGIKDQPIRLLSALGGCIIAEWDGDERCCGFGGLFALRQPETSVAMADEKIEGLGASGAEILVGSDSSCLMHLEGRLRRLANGIAVKHLAEVLDEASND